MQWIDDIALPTFPRPEYQLDYEVRMQEEESMEHARLRRAEEELRRQNRTVTDQYNLRRRAVGRRQGQRGNRGHRSGTM